MTEPPYPRPLERMITRMGGEPYYVRPLQPDDASLIEELTGRMSPEDRRFRFFAPLLKLDARLAARLSRLDYDRDMGLLATATLRGNDVLAIAWFFADCAHTEAEFAIAVRSDRQGQGVGFSLMTCLGGVAKERGLQRLWGWVLPDNARMLHLAHALGMHIAPRAEGDAVQVVWDLSIKVQDQA